MSDIFAEVDADLRRDRWQALWDRYGLLIIGGAVMASAEMWRKPRKMTEMLN